MKNCQKLDVGTVTFWDLCSLEPAPTVDRVCLAPSSLPISGRRPRWVDRCGVGRDRVACLKGGVLAGWCGVESVRSWVRQADIDDGYTPGVSTSDARRIRELEQENRELKRAKEISETSGQFLRGGARPANTRNSRLHRRQPRRFRGQAHLHRPAQRRDAGGPEYLLRRVPTTTPRPANPQRGSSVTPR